MSEAYFSDLNYSLANEDTRLELEICRRYRPKSILSICGSGGRFLPLLAAEPKAITAVDLAPQQLWLAELRKMSILHFDFQSFLLFWGFPPYSVDENRERRRELYESLTLSGDCRKYFDEAFARINYKGLLYEGKWEKTIAFVPNLLRKVVGTAYDELFDFRTQKEQDAFIEEKLKSPIWKSVPKATLLIFGNAAFFNALLYRGHFVKKNKDISYYQFYRQTFLRLFKNGLARDNFFMQLVFFGQIKHPEGVTIEAHEDVFLACKRQLEKKASINLVQANVIDYAKSTKERFDFVSLSDVPSYFSGDTEKNYLQDLRQCLNPGALVVLRSYLRIPEGTIMTGYTEVTPRYQDLIALEKVQVYDIQVFEYKG